MANRYEDEARQILRGLWVGDNDEQEMLIGRIEYALREVERCAREESIRYWRQAEAECGMMSWNSNCSAQYAEAAKYYRERAEEAERAATQDRTTGG
jgi:pyridoxine/pyridoxamine 5'-phosphate oxidase